MEFKTNNNKITVDEIEQFTLSIGKKLPSDYLAFLLEYNGGKPNKNLLEIKDKNGDLIDSTILKYFYGLNTNSYNTDILGHILMFRERLVSDMIPIANDVFGNQLCMSLNTINYGSIYFWYHDSDSLDNSLYYITESFEKCIDSLKTQPLLEDEGEVDEIITIIRNGYLNDLKFLLGRNVPITSERNLFLEAISYNQIEIIKILAEYGISLKGVLAYVASEVTVSIVETLLNLGVDPNDTIPDTNYSAIMSAVEGKNVEVIHLLKKNGANIDIDNPEWKSIINQAIRAKDFDIVKVLKEELKFPEHKLKIKS